MCCTLEINRLASFVSFTRKVDKTFRSAALLRPPDGQP